MRNEHEAVRLDKWLWAARFYKTRALARTMIDGGKVRYNGQRSKPGKLVEVGAEITLQQGYEQKSVLVLALSAQRSNATIAGQLYQETAASLHKREQIAQARKLGALTLPHPDRKPDKKERRELIQFKLSQ